MANEATIRTSLKIAKGNLQYQSLPTTFIADVSEGTGPTPGEISISTSGTDIDLSQVDVPGLAFIQNRDDTNYVDYGIYDPETFKFYPLGRLYPGEGFPIRISPRIQEEYGTGTGSIGPGTNRLRFQAHNSSCRVLVNVFGE